MKSIIVTSSLLILFLAILAQNSLDVVTEGRREVFDSIVQVFIQKARFDGYFTEDNINELKSTLISKIHGLKESDIIIDVTQTPKYHKNTFNECGKIQYKISIPIEKIIAFGDYFNITNNSCRYGVEGYVLSEVPMP